ncbi:MAG: membrane protein insertase YidC [Candidatus Omnitrophica bacterium]|nr:membrane protein insertase YidC [Candidatus Omnitrophota bacterium]MDD5653395.1 membrane protein insertase YidC [Candidatus Omnitrophota bacterium]
MEKRLILAISVSMLVLLAWSAIMPKPPVPVKAEAVSVVTKTAQAVTQTSKESVSTPPKEQAVFTEAKFATSLFSLNFFEPIAALNDAIFKQYQSHRVVLSSSFLLGGQDLIFHRENSAPGTLVFVQSDNTKKIKKEFIFSKNSYAIDLVITISNLSNLNFNYNLPLSIGKLNFSGDQNIARFEDVMIATKEKKFFLNGKKDAQEDNVKYVAIREKYFTLIAEPENESSAFVKKIDAKDSEIGLLPKNINIAPGGQFVQKVHIYLGPLDLKQINAVKPEWGNVVNYGTFDFIGQIVLQLLEFFHRLVGNWGVAIILLSLGIYLLLYPFTLKQMRSMKEMQALQPKVEALRITHKDNPQKLNKEILELYREHKVNPLGGCLPLLLQMPVFFALYQVMIRCVALKGAKFLWIKDLSEPDKLFLLPTNLPVLGNEFNLLPLLMAALMFVQQKASLVSSGSTSEEQQKIMMIVMPIMFGVIFYRMPSGLVLYWFVNSLLMLIYQLKVKSGK